MKVSLTQAAQLDLSSIANWIAHDGANTARRIARGLRDACRNLSQTPYAYAVVEEGRYRGLRRRPYSRYLIYYRVEPDQIVVIAIMDGARDMEGSL